MLTIIVNKYLTVQFQTIKPNCHVANPSFNPSGYLFPIWPRKRRRIEDLSHSHTVDKVVKLIGRGQLSISAAADIARGVVPNLTLLSLNFLLGSTKFQFQNEWELAHIAADPNGGMVQV